VTISDGTVTVLAGDDVLDVYPAGTWYSVGQIRLAEGQYMLQRDGRAVICQSPAEVSP
jgi:hypothetical protein